MEGVGGIDRFLDRFSRYIDSGFGLIAGDVGFLASSLIVIDVTLALLFATWGESDDVVARLVKKTLQVGFFAFLIANWNGLAKIIYLSFSGIRSEEHTSELQSLMRISYAVFCLKKKTK